MTTPSSTVPAPWGLTPPARAQMPQEPGHSAEAVTPRARGTPPEDPRAGCPRPHSLCLSRLLAAPEDSRPWRMPHASPSMPSLPPWIPCVSPLLSVCPASAKHWSAHRAQPPRVPTPVPLPHRGPPPQGENRPRGGAIEMLHRVETLQSLRPLSPHVARGSREQAFIRCELGRGDAGLVPTPDCPADGTCSKG